MPSTVISKIDYDIESRTLLVVFLSGAIYRYKDVPDLVYMQMMQSGSKGVFLNKHIKGFYEFDKVE